MSVDRRSGVVGFRKPTCHGELTLTDDSLKWVGKDEVVRTWTLDVIYGVISHYKDFAFIIHIMPLKTVGKTQRLKQTVTFHCDSTKEVHCWIDAIRCALAGDPMCVTTPTKRRLLVLVNPVGGFKQARKINNKIVKPMMCIADVNATYVETECSKHAYDLMMNLDLSLYDGVVTVSGDGVLHEVLNGLLNRPDWRVASAVPIGIIPAGSGNSMARSLDICDPSTGAFVAIKGMTQPLDIMAIVQSGKVIFSHLLITYGIVADVDIESERFRALGSCRFAAYAILRMLNLRKYPARLSFLPVENDQDSDIVTDDNFMFTAQVPETEKCSLSDYILAHPKKHPEGWVNVSAEFAYFLAQNVGWSSSDILSAPFSCPNDGAIDLLYIEHSDTSSLKMMKTFLSTESGEFVLNPDIKYQKVRAFSLEPIATHGIIYVDGEAVDHKPITCQSLPRLARMMVPSSLKLPVWDWKTYPNAANIAQNQMNEQEIRNSRLESVWRRS